MKLRILYYYTIFASLTIDDVVEYLSLLLKKNLGLQHIEREKKGTDCHLLDDIKISSSFGNVFSNFPNCMG